MGEELRVYGNYARFIWGGESANVCEKKKEYILLKY